MSKTIKIKTQELTGNALDWAVATCLGYNNLRRNCHRFDDGFIMDSPQTGTVFLSELDYSSNWSKAGQVIDLMGDYCQEGNKAKGEYYCSTPSVAETWHNHPVRGTGPTPIIAAMRCYVASKRGSELKIPAELVDVCAKTESNTGESATQPKKLKR